MAPAAKTLPREALANRVTWHERWLQHWMVSRLDRPRFKRVVDLGSGHGDVLAPLADELLAFDLATPRLPQGIDLASVGGLERLRDDAVRDVLYRIRQAAIPSALVIARACCTFNFGRPSIDPIHRRPRDLVALAESVGLRCLEVRSAPSIYAEMMGNAATHWPLRLVWRLATLYRTRASHMFVFRA